MSTPTSPYRTTYAVTVRVTELLEALGATEGAVAQTLVDGGHVGVRHNCSRCPIAVYLAATDLGWPAQVSGVGVFVEFTDTAGDDYSIVVRLTDAALDFATFFDCGVYPELRAVTA